MTGGIGFPSWADHLFLDIQLGLDAAVEPSVLAFLLNITKHIAHIVPRDFIG